jgi:hypothetical protein
MRIKRQEARAKNQDLRVNNKDWVLL